MKDCCYNRSKSFLYNEQKFKDISLYIFNNKDKSYDEIFKGLEIFNVTVYNLFNFVSKYEDSYKQVVDSIRIIIDYKKKEKKNIKDNDLEQKFKQIGNLTFIENNIAHPKNRTIYDLENRKSIEEQEAIEDETNTIIKEIISSNDENEIYEKYNLTENKVKYRVSKYLKNNPKLYVDYMMHKFDLNPISNEEIEEAKLSVDLIIDKLQLTIDELVYMKQISSNKKDIENKIRANNKILKQYINAKRCLNFEITLGASEIPDVDENIIKYVLYVSKIIKCRKALNNNFMSDKKLEYVYNYFDEKLSIN